MRRFIPFIVILVLASSCMRPIDRFNIRRGGNIAHWLSQSNVRGERRAAYFVNMWQSFETASQLAIPEGDPNIILSFHYYQPMLLTHYQASWMDLKDYRGPVHYPGEVVTSSEMADRPDTDRTLSSSWTDQVYDKERFAREFGMAAQVAKDHGIPVYCGEYGCLSVEPDRRMLDCLIR